MSNFRNDNKSEISRGHHLAYNIENYFIRLDSMCDRVRQTVNAVFNLAIKERGVSGKIVINKMKEVKRSSGLVSLLNDLQNLLFNYSDEIRNIIVFIIPMSIRSYIEL
ncbi:hypothetical protein IWX84_001484 [Flavobacterium sp. CG_9.10]|uniref:Cthe_2314 family HEPN domain-containing protein n=1 Tax=Flavobacterium sp. CG_9.10 TaxID=2787729 RepID=UPI0018C9EFD5|nr:Cthe_2314 family HEPN domain-containing protein [Flavobacterium sp. CG_9.10]MBG6110605.1 hypothetical protein [Flavobacterium sp. CG_9.10]